MYALMLDLRGLSERNHFHDDSDEVFIIFTVDMGSKLIGVSHSTVSTLFAEIEKHGLI